MKKLTRKLAKVFAAGISAAVLALILGLGTPSGARADAAEAKRLLKAMSNYMAAQKVISFAYDASLEVVTKDHQTLALLSSGTVTLNRPDKIRATRSGGFADVEMLFDAKTLTLLGKNANLYAQIDIPGTIDHLTLTRRIGFEKRIGLGILLWPEVHMRNLVSRGKHV